MDRKDQYKTSGHNVTAQRSKRRDQEAVIRKEKRDKLLSSKRIRFSEIENDCEIEDYTVEQVQELARTIQKSDKNILNSLKSLRKAFTQGSELISAFLAVDNSMRALVGHLTGNNAQLQLEAAWCITNLATGVHDDTMKVLKASAAYLITYLSGQNVQLQDQCAWALGNFSGDSQECREILRAQGIIVPMVNLLKVFISTVCLSAVVGDTRSLTHSPVPITPLWRVGQQHNLSTSASSLPRLDWHSRCFSICLFSFSTIHHHVIFGRPLLRFPLQSEKCHDAMDIVLDSRYGSGSQGATPGQTGVILVCSHSPSLHPGILMVTGQFLY